MVLCATITAIFISAAFFAGSHGTYDDMFGEALGATSPPEGTLVDQEEDGDFASGSGAVDQESEYQWLVRHRTSGLHVANSAEIGELLEYIAAHRQSGEDVLVSQAPTQLEDGPMKLVEESEKRSSTPPTEATARPEVVGEILEEVVSTNFYPQYAVGILENSCTAFLVGPRHALTTANCVYNYYSNSWENELDFWRGRKGDEYLEKMYWDHVVISAKFFVTGNYVYNWALIAFMEDSASPVWLKMAYSSKVHDKAMTVYGYLVSDHPWGTMYYTVCRSNGVQDDPKQLAIQCGTSQKFSGGPILKGYNFQRSKMPLVYGISVAYDYSYSHTAMNFHPNLFWSLCHFMVKDGFDAKCGPQQQ